PTAAMRRSGSASPSRPPRPAATPSRIVSATAIPTSTCQKRYLVAKVNASSCDLSPSSARATRPSAVRRSVTVAVSSVLAGRRLGDLDRHRVGAGAVGSGLDERGVGEHEVLAAVFEEVDRRLGLLALAGQRRDAPLA